MSCACSVLAQCVNLYCKCPVNAQSCKCPVLAQCSIQHATSCMVFSIYPVLRIAYSSGAATFWPGTCAMLHCTRAPSVALKFFITCSCSPNLLFLSPFHFPPIPFCHPILVPNRFPQPTLLRYKARCLVSRAPPLRSGYWKPWF